MPCDNIGILYHARAQDMVARVLGCLKSPDGFQFRMSEFLEITELEDLITC